MARPARHVFVITGAEMVAALRDTLDADQTVVVIDGTDALRTLQVLQERLPKVVAVDLCFLETSYGQEFARRIRETEALSGIDVRVFSPLQMRRTAGVSPRAMIAAASEPLPPGVFRRAPRVPMADHVAALVNGSALTVVDLSVLGAQVISAQVLRPNQHVAMRLRETAGELRVKGAIAWSVFERSQTTRQPQYRAGLEFTTSDPQALERYCRENERREESLRATG